MTSQEAVLHRFLPTLLAAALSLAISACSSEPAQLGTPAYALQRLFSPGPYRSTDEMLAAIKPAPVEPTPAASESPPPETTASSPPTTETASATAVSSPAAVTFIQLNEYPLAPPSYPFTYPWYARPTYAYSGPYRPVYPRPYGPGGYRRCFGSCGGLNVSIGAGNSRVNLNAGYAASSTTSSVVLRPPLTIAP